MNAVTNKRITFVIPTFNSNDYTIECVKSILKYCDFSKGDKAVIVVDDGSKISQKREMKEWFESQESNKDVMYYNHDVNKGVGAAFNTGIALVDSEFYIRLDNDTKIAEKDFDEKLIAFLEEDESLGLITCMTDHTSQKLQIINVPYVITVDEDIVEFIKNRDIRGELRYCDKPVEALAGYCFAFRKKDFKKIGGFSTEMKMLGEDNLFYLDMLMLKKKCAIANKLFIHHHHHGTSEGIDAITMKATQIAAQEAWQKKIKEYQKNE